MPRDVPVLCLGLKTTAMRRGGWLWHQKPLEMEVESWKKIVYKTMIIWCKLWFSIRKSSINGVWHTMTPSPKQNLRSLLNLCDCFFLFRFFSSRNWDFLHHKLWESEEIWISNRMGHHNPLEEFILSQQTPSAKTEVLLVTIQKGQSGSRCLLDYYTLYDD